MHPQLRPRTPDSVSATCRRLAAVQQFAGAAACLSWFATAAVLVIQCVTPHRYDAELLAVEIATASIAVTATVAWVAECVEQRLESAQFDAAFSDVLAEQGLRREAPRRPASS